MNRGQVYFFGPSAPTLQGNGLWKLDVLRCGKWDYPAAGGDNGFEITPTVLREIKANFDAGIKGNEIPINLDHKEDSSLEVKGWVKAVGLDEGGERLFVMFEPTDPEVKEKLENGTLKFSSGELDFDYVSPELSAKGDETPRAVLEAVALTARPYIKGLRPVERVLLSDKSVKLIGANQVHVNSDQTKVIAPSSEGEEDEGVAEVYASEDDFADDREKGKNMPTLEEATAENEALKKKLSDAESKLKAAEEKTSNGVSLAEFKELKTKLRLSEVENLTREKRLQPKLTPALRKRFLRLAELLVLGGCDVVSLSSPTKPGKHRLDEKDDKAIDKLDVIGEVADMLAQLPDAVAMDSDGSKVDLEDDDAQDGKADDESAVIKKADELQANDPKLTDRKEAIKKARKMLTEGRHAS